MAVQGPFVEFFNPKIRRELEKKDEEIKKTTGKGGAPGGDEWTYLTSFSRVPVSLRKLKSTKKYRFKITFQQPFLITTEKKVNHL